MLYYWRVQLQGIFSTAEGGDQLTFTPKEHVSWDVQ